MTEGELIYAAAVIDCEGHIGLHGYAKRPNLVPHERVAVGNTDARLIEWLNARWPGHVALNHRIGSRPTHKPLWLWSLSARKAHRFILEVRPYLVIKGEQADLILAHRALARGGNGHQIEDASVVAEREEIRHRLRLLTKRGA